MARKSTKENKNIYQRTRESLDLTREENPEVAMAWLKEAAEQGSYLAMRKMYWATCDSDPAGAAAWLRKAADAGDSGSRLALDCLDKGCEVRFCREQEECISYDITDEERAFLAELDEEDD